MVGRLRRLILDIYEHSLEREISDPPEHVAVIQDGNRRYARQSGDEVTTGHRVGAKTTERVLEWCRDIGIVELTLYAFSTENFDRPQSEQDHLFDLISEKLRDLADKDDIHEEGVRISAIGELGLLPDRVRQAAHYAERRTCDYDNFRLNVALAYGGRAELVTAARAIAQAVDDGVLSPQEIGVEDINARLYDGIVTDVDLIIRTGGDERTSNFLPWHANGNEAAVYFCHPFWPEFSKRDFLRAIRTYEYREQRWHQSRADRALSLLRAFGGHDLPKARSILSGVTSESDHDDQIIESATSESAD